MVDRDFAETSSFGYWVRRRRLALDLTQAMLARRVGCATVTIKKIERDERRPSRLMAQRLAESLGIPSEQQEGFIQRARGERRVDTLPFPTAPIPRGAPSELGGSSHKFDPGTERGHFLGRQQQLSWLESVLERALQNQGRAGFPAGEAGSGKTADRGAFARRAHEIESQRVLAELSAILPKFLALVVRELSLESERSALKHAYTQKVAIQE